MYDLREDIKTLWLEYDAGHLSFTAASLATETAFSIMRYADEEFVEAYPDLASFCARLQWMQIGMCAISKICFVYPHRYVNQSVIYRICISPRLRSIQEPL